MFRHFPLVVRNATRNRRRSLLTVLSISTSLCLLGVLMALYHQFYLRDPADGQSPRLVVRNRISITNIMPVSYREKIKTLPGVREITVFQYFGGTYKDTREMKNLFSRFAIEADKLFTIYPEFEVPDDQKAAFLKDRTGCIIGEPLAVRLNLKIGDRMVIQGDIFPVLMDMKVRAIYHSPRDSENLFFHDEYMRESLAKGFKDVVSMFVVRAENTEVMPRVSRTIDEMFRNSQYETQTDTERAFEMSFLGYLGNVKMFLLSIGGALTFTVMLVSANTMAMSVRERVKEVGILKSLGFTRGTILGILIAESVLIAIAGGLIGLLFSNLILKALKMAPSIFVNLKTVALTPPLAVTCLVLAALIGFVSCVIPAYSASRRSIVEAMRYND
jgi:putative ABC transport system permease protein